MAHKQGPGVVSDDFILLTENLTKEFAGFVAVNGVSLQVSRGTIHALIGPNGAGKTSVLRAIANLVPFQGDVLVGGRAVTGIGARALARQVAMLVQEPDMPAGMTVAHYVLLGRTPHLGYLGREGEIGRAHV